VGVGGRLSLVQLGHAGRGAQRPLSEAKRKTCARIGPFPGDPTRTWATTKDISLDRPRLPGPEFGQLHCCILIHGVGIRRREFLTLLGGSVVAWN
jgi:hypothetical protein